MTPEDWVRVASAPDVEPLESEDGQTTGVAAEVDEPGDMVPAEPEPAETTAMEAVAVSQADDPVREAESPVAGYEAVGEAGEAFPVPVEMPEAIERRDDEEAAAETVLLGGAGGPLIVERSLTAEEAESQAPREASDPSGGPRGPVALEAGQADGPNGGLSPRTVEAEKAGVVGAGDTAGGDGLSPAAGEPPGGAGPDRLGSPDTGAHDLRDPERRIVGTRGGVGRGIAGAAAACGGKGCGGGIGRYGARAGAERLEFRCGC